MKIVKFNIPAEVKKALRGEKTKVDALTLLHSIGDCYLAALKAKTVALHWQ